mmetsp:Transcript_89120/g.288653  ORF Transcript_89120/g.288653 Transcript_89120/m.288653 type:complete len:276 (+) Transcript_89120:18-845(+)
MPAACQLRRGQLLPSSRCSGRRRPRVRLHRRRVPQLVLQAAEDGHGAAHAAVIAGVEGGAVAEPAAAEAVDAVAEVRGGVRGQLQRVRKHPPDVQRLLVDAEVGKVGAAAAVHVLAVGPDDEEQVEAQHQVRGHGGHAAGAGQAAGEGRGALLQNVRQRRAGPGEQHRLHGEGKLHRDAQHHVAEVDAEEHLDLGRRAPGSQRNDGQPREAEARQHQLEVQVRGHAPLLLRREDHADGLDDEENVEGKVRDQDHIHSEADGAAAAKHCRRAAERC